MFDSFCSDISLCRVPNMGHKLGEGTLIVQPLRRWTVHNGARGKPALKLPSTKLIVYVRTKQ